MRSDDEQRFHLRERPYHPNLIRRSPTCRSCASASDNAEARNRAIEFLRIRRHQRHAGVQADGCVRFCFRHAPRKRGIQYSAALMFHRNASCLLDRPLSRVMTSLGMSGGAASMQDLMKGQARLIMGVAQ